MNHNTSTNKNNNNTLVPSTTNSSSLTSHQEKERKRQEEQDQFLYGRWILLYQHLQLDKMREYNLRKSEIEKKEPIPKHMEPMHEQLWS